MPTSRLPKRVLFLTHALNLSGVTVHMHSVTKALAAQNIEFHVAARVLDEGQPFGLEYFQRAGIMVHQIDFPGYGFNLENIRKARMARQQLEQLIKRLGIDLVHIHAPTLALVARRPCRRMNIPYVTTFNIAVTGKVKCRLARLAHQLTRNPFGELVIAISREMADHLVSDLHVPVERIRKIPYVVDDSRYAPATSQERCAARASLVLRSEDFVLAVIASYDPRKNHELLFDAIARCKSAGQTIVALCAGSDFCGDLPRLQQMAADRGIAEQIKLLGFAKSLDIFHASDAAALTSFSEGFPLAIVEAMHCGLPIIRTPSEGANEQIRDGRNGTIVPFGEPEVLATLLRQWASDPQQRQRMGEASRAIALQDYTLAAMGQRMTELYAEAIQRFDEHHTEK